MLIYIFWRKIQFKKWMEGLNSGSANEGLGSEFLVLETMYKNIKDSLYHRYVWK